MVGGRVSHSIDIGKELEKGLPQEPRQEEAATPEETPSEQEKQQETAVPEQQPPSAETTPPAQTAQELLGAREGQASPPEDEDEDEPEEPALPPDPVEEDVNEILTKHIPQLRSKKTIWGRITPYRIPAFILLVILVGGWFLLRSMVIGAEPKAEAVQLPAVGPMVVSNITPVSTVPAHLNETGEDSREELAAILTRGLRD